MWIASVPAAAAPLPGVAPAAAPSGEAAPFDEALAASLDRRYSRSRPTAHRHRAPAGSGSSTGCSAASPWSGRSAAVGKIHRVGDGLVEEELDSAEEADDEAEEIPQTCG